jgi:hypothetical protein
MTAPVYDTDLQDVTLADAIGTWDEMVGRSSGGAETLEDRAYIQGNYCISQATGVQTGRTCGLEFDYGSNITWTSGWVLYVWQYWQAPIAIGTWADGGVRFCVGSSAGNHYAWNAIGNDVGRYPYGGWANNAIDPEYTADETINSPTSGNYRWFGSTPYILSAVNKGNPHCVDAIRYGRGTLYAEYGESGNYATFAGMAAENDNTANRYGIFSYQIGSYLFKGLLSLGTASNAVNFIDANRSIIINDTPRTYADFNRIEIRHVDSVVNWSNISFKALGTLSAGRLEVINNADVTMDGCAFQDMDTFIFQSNSEITNTIFKTCNAVTGGGGIFTGCKFLTSKVSADASAFIWNQAVNLDGKIDGATFSKGANAHHAITLGASAQNTHTIRNVIFSGFNATDGQNDSVLYLADQGSDKTWTIGCVGCTGTVSYKKARSGDTVNITQGVSLSVHVQDADTGSSITGARVLVMAASGGPKPYQASVGLARSGSTVTVTHTGHGLVSNDWVVIQTATYGDYNGVWQITVTGVDAYTFDIGAKTPNTPDTATATFAPIHATTDGSGNVSDTRTYSADQPFYGRVRKASAPTYYKNAPLSGTISSSTGASVTVQMVSES